MRAGLNSCIVKYNIPPSKKYLRLFTKHAVIFLKSRVKKGKHFSREKEYTTGLNNLKNLVKRKVIESSNSELIPRLKV